MTQLMEIPSEPPQLPPRAVGPAGPPALIEGESVAEYDALLARIANALQPADVLEEIWIRDVVDLSWEVFRLRRLKAELMAAAAHEGMQEVLEPLFPSAGTGRSLARRWAAGPDEDTRQQIETAMGKAGLSRESVAARTLAVRIDDFERIEGMLMEAEARRAAALHELDRHRANFGLRLRCTLQAIDRPHVGPVPLDR